MDQLECLGLWYAAFQKAKGTPVIRVCSSSGTEIFQLDSLDARVAFFAVVNPVWRGAAHATSTNLVSYIPKPGIQKAVFEANADLKNLYERYDQLRLAWSPISMVLLWTGPGI